jgi:predicted DCC family thiol-disulfide oxidoreductase YuxK
MAGWILYDGDCELCRRWAIRFEPALARHGFTLRPLQSIDVRAMGIPQSQWLDEMRVVANDGTVLGGADALLHIAQVMKPCRGFALLTCLPGIKPLLRRGYRWLARHRACAGGLCRTPRAAKTFTESLTTFGPVVALTVMAIFCGQNAPPWAFTWIVALALYAGCKWMSFRTAKAAGARPGFALRAGFFAGWVGMDATTFFQRNRVAEKPHARQWAWAVFKTCAGMLLLWAGARNLFPAHALLAGWMGMVGLILVLHFGWFELLALAWRRAGIDALPLMREPLRATSLAEFWGRRWNSGFHHLAHGFVFQPMRRVVAAPVAMMLVFLASGVVHELVISVPARGGYGGPTIYFLIQGAGVWWERTPFARWCGLGRGRRGWLFTLLVVAGPVDFLFHRPFVLNVMVPFFQVIGALGKVL